MNDLRTEFQNALQQTREKYPTWRHDAQFARAVRDHKVLYLAMCHEHKEKHAPAARGVAQFGNTTNAATVAQEDSSLSKPQRAVIFDLPGIDDRTFDRLWHKNRNRLYPVDYNSLLGALVSCTMEEQKGSRLDAVQRIADRWPVFFAKVTGVGQKPSEDAEPAADAAAAPEVANTKTALLSAQAKRIAESLKIPNCTAPEFANVMEALGGNTASGNHAATFSALVNFHQKDRRITYMQSVHLVQRLHPDLGACFAGPRIDTRGIQK